jgi:DNA repair exonuclease SbcCD ATPase subunit
MPSGGVEGIGEDGGPDGFGAGLGAELGAGPGDARPQGGAIGYEVVAAACDRLLARLGNRDLVTARVVQQEVGGAPFDAVAEHIRSWKQERAGIDAPRPEIRPEERDHLVRSIEAVVAEVTVRERLRTQQYWADRTAGMADELAALHRLHRDAVEEAGRLDRLLARERARNDEMLAELDRARALAAEAAGRAEGLERQLADARRERQAAEAHLAEARQAETRAKAQAEAADRVIETAQGALARLDAEGEEARREAQAARQEARTALADARNAWGEARAWRAKAEHLAEDLGDLRDHAEERARRDGAEIMRLNGRLERAAAEREAAAAELRRLQDQAAAGERALAASQAAAQRLAAELDRARAEADSLRPAPRPGHESRP